MYDADENAQDLDVDDVLAIIEYPEVEIFDGEFPEEYGK